MFRQLPLLYAVVPRGHVVPVQKDNKFCVVPTETAPSLRGFRFRILLKRPRAARLAAWYLAMPCL